jgi:hypothetical protein
MAIAEIAAGQHQRGDRDRIAVDDPLQLRHPGAEVGPQARDRDVDDRHVEQDEEHPDAHDDEREGALVIGHGSTVGPRRFVSGRRVPCLTSVPCQATSTSLAPPR